MINITIKELQRLLTLFFWLALAIFCISLPCTAVLIIQAPEDSLQGWLAKIMYIHVPSAWLSSALYLFIAISGLFFLIWRKPILDLIIKSVAPLGTLLTFITLVTGALWGKPAWGTWWVWDARLTSVFVLLLLYLIHDALRASIKNEVKAGLICALFLVIGLINLPIIKFSVEFWNTLHQPSSVFRLSGPSIHISMLWPLISSTITLSTYCLILGVLRVKTELMYKRLFRVRIKGMK